jgi:HEAT repeat protein
MTIHVFSNLMKITPRSFALSLASLSAAVALLLANPARAADSPTASPAEKQQELLRLLRSDAPPGDKAITCKKLAIYGTREAVPALAALLSDADLSSWARIALEVIPDPAADAALRDALGKLQGRLLIGVINSLGVRRDARAVGELAKKLKDADPEVASAAAEALGQIGGGPAAKALEQALAKAQPDVRAAVAEGCILCAEKMLAAGKSSDAARLYDAVRRAQVPRQRILEATRGAILARGPSGIPLLLEQLRSADKAMFGIGLRTARELPGPEVTKALLQELDRTAAGRQVPLLLAVADRRDAAVLPKVLALARHGTGETRKTALGLLERFSDPACVPVLLHAAAEDDPDLTRTAKAGLARLEGAKVDADLLARLPESTGRTRQALLEVVALRRISAAVPVVVQSAEDADPAVRRAAFDTLGVLGGESQAADLVRLLSKAQAGRERADVERALVSICGRRGKACLPHVLPLAKSSESWQREVGLHALASIGGPEPLAAVQAAVNDFEEAVQDEAVGILATWPGNWPEDVDVAPTLLDLARSGRKLAHRVQGMRGYLQFVEENKRLGPEDKLAMLRELLPVVQRPEEKRRVIAVAGTVPAAGALQMLVALAQEPAVAEEASLAILKLAASDSLKDGSRELRQKALQTVLEKSLNDATRRKADAALKRLP